MIAAIGLLFPALLIVIMAPYMLRTCTEMVHFFLSRSAEMDIFSNSVIVGIFFNYFARLALPILAIAVVGGLFSNLVQVGFLFTTKPLVPDFSKVLPKFGRYFGKIFSMEGLFNLFKSIAKMIIIGAIAYNVISSSINELANLQTADLWRGITLVASLASRMIIIAAVFLLVLAIPDYLFQRHQFRESLKMTREQFKEEQKQEEGDPQIRSRLRRLYRDLLTQNMLASVPKADVVITNPEHYSVALEYDYEKMIAPTVTAKGEDELAFRIREIAEANGVPVIPHPPLTRELYKFAEIGEPVPIRYWEVMITILGQVFRADKKQKEQKTQERTSA